MCRTNSPAVLFVLGGFLLNAVPAAAQEADLDWSEEAELLGVNALLGGVSAGLAAAIRGDSFVRAFLDGAGGGGLAYFGKRVASRPDGGAGLLGRQIASFGSSVVGNVVAGRGRLDRIALAVGPVRAYVGRSVPGVEWRLDVPAFGFAAVALLQGKEVDLSESFSSGVVVIRDESEKAVPGTIFYIPFASAERQAYTLSHERVHVLQYDQSFLFWGGPLEAWLAREIPSARGVLQHFEFNLPVLATAAGLGFYVWTEHDEQPWEHEAMYLGRTRRWD